MRRFAAASLVVALLLIATTVVRAQFAPPLPLEFRHEASPSTAIYQNGVALGAKVLYVRDNQAPDTCTQVIILPNNVMLAVAAHKGSCAF